MGRISNSVLLAIVLLIIGGLIVLNWPTEAPPVELNPDLQVSPVNTAAQQSPSPNKEASGALTKQTAEQGIEQDLQLSDLTLIGVVSSDDQTLSSATIKSNIQIQQYFLGDQIAYTQATLSAIFPDRVVLSLAGNDYILFLEQSAEKTISALPHENQTNNTTSKPRSNAEEIGNRPKRLDHIVTLSPVNDGGTGFRVAPGLNPDLFKAARFQPGDILQKINGKDLSDPEQYRQVLQMVPNAQALAFTVLRAGRQITLYLDIPSKGLKIIR